MNTRAFVRDFRGGLLGMLLWTAVTVACAAHSDRPNILLVMVDDLGFSDLGSYGSEIATPTLDRLAEQGIRFSNFTSCGKCWSSRVSLLTGRYYPESTIHGPLRNSVTIAEVLAEEGYQTWCVGKWHQRAHPMDAGFQQFVGHLNRPTPPRLKGSDYFMIDREPYNDFSEGWWATSFYVDHIVEKLRQREKGQPFFCYFAPDTPHWPYQAPREFVEPYLEVYKVGWEPLRRDRFDRQRAIGLAEPGWSYPPRPDDVPEHFWRLEEAERERHVMAMAGFAGSITALDKQFERVIEELREQGELENTMILFLSDNGACDRDFTKQRTREKMLPPWDAESFWAFGPEWAHLSNTPFRRYKNDMHEGGVASPLIVHWPAGMAPELTGGFVRERSHIVDILPTALEAAGVAYPEAWEGTQVGPSRGVSLVPAVQAQPWLNRLEHWYRLSSTTALVQWPWKVVNPEGGGELSLYNLVSDRAETVDLKHDLPQVFFGMRARHSEIEAYLRQAETPKGFYIFRDLEP